MRARRLLSVATLTATAAIGCSRPQGNAPPPPVAATSAPPETSSAAITSAPAAPASSAPSQPVAGGPLVETIYDGGYRGWGDWGWAPKEIAGPGPAKIKFANWGGWILVKQDRKPQ